MSNYYERSSPQRQGIFIILLFIIAAAITISFFPTQGKFKYEYQKGNPWQHEDLVAPFEFAIYKSDTELKEGKDSLQKYFKPYFNYNSEVGLNEINRFLKNFDSRFSSSLTEVKKQLPKYTYPDSLRNFILGVSKDIINFTYEKGVVEYSEFLEKEVKGNALVIVKNNLAETRDVEEVFTPKKAYSFIDKKLKKDFSSQPKIEALIKNLKLHDYIKQNLVYDELTTQRVKEEMLATMSTKRGMVRSGELIISRGDLVHEEKFLVLESFKKEYQDNLGTSVYLKWLYVGQIIIVLLCFIILYLFLFNFRREILTSLQKTLFILMMVMIMVITASVVVKFNQINIYMIPFVALPIIIHAFYDSRLAFFIHMVTIMIIGFLAPNGFEFVFLQFMVGAVSIFSLAQLHRRGQLFAAVGFIVLTYILGYTALGIMQEGDPMKINPYHYLWFIGNGLLLLICYPLIFIFEKLFGFISDVTLIELSDTNHPALRDLAEKAPGTFHHVIQVANLAEAGSRKIGANALLTRVGALYHDIGKGGAPGFFIENQVGKSAHDGLKYEKSAEMIIQHVHYGMELARKYKLPKVVADFIVTHHGTGLVKYFYTKYSNDNDGIVPDVSKFSYPGPAPFTRETAVLMMADAVEASSRTLKEYNEASISELVERIINNQIDDNQFEEAEITFKDIYHIKQVFKQKLMNIYHSRIEYPDMKKH